MPSSSSRTGWFDVIDTPYGVMQIHGYPFDRTGSTFIVEMSSAVWEAAGFGEHARELAPGESDDASIAQVRALFGSVLDGHEVLANKRIVNELTAFLAADQVGVLEYLKML